MRFLRRLVKSRLAQFNGAAALVAVTVATLTGSEQLGQLAQDYPVLAVALLLGYAAVNYSGLRK